MTADYLVHLASLGATHIHPLGREATTRLIAALQLEPGQRILEVGCGTGATLIEAACAARVSVHAIEPAPEMLQTARRRLWLAAPQNPVQLIQASGAGLPLVTDSYHRVYTESVLGFQTADVAQQTLAEIWRVLYPGGRYVANEAIWRRGVTAEQSRAIYEACVRDFGLCQASPQPWGLSEWERAMRSAGFRVISATLLDTLSEESEHSAETRERRWRSELLTAFYHFKGYLSPAIVRQRSHYRKLLEAHRGDGHYIESRLFVLEKLT